MGQKKGGNLSSPLFSAKINLTESQCIGRYDYAFSWRSPKINGELSEGFRAKSNFI